MKFWFSAGLACIHPYSDPVFYVPSQACQASADWRSIMLILCFICSVSIIFLTWKRSTDARFQALQPCAFLSLLSNTLLALLRKSDCAEAGLAGPQERLRWQSQRHLLGPCRPLSPIPNPSSLLALLAPS